MQILRKIGLSIIVAVLIFEAVIAVFIIFNFLPKEVTTFFVGQHIYSLKGKLIMSGGAILFVLLSFLIIYFEIKEEREKLAISIPNPLGEVKVSAEAIENFIKRTVEQKEEVKEIKARLIKGKKGVEIHSRVSLWSGNNIPEATDNIQSAIKDYTQNVLGIPEVREIKVFVKEIAQRKKEKEENI